MNVRVIKDTYAFMAASFPDLRLSSIELAEKLELVKTLLIEEHQELLAAYVNNDVDEIVNALSDIKVVALNAAFYKGYNRQHLEGLYILKSKQIPQFAFELSTSPEVLLENEYDKISDVDYLNHIVCDILIYCDYIAANNSLIGSKRLREEDLKTFKSNMTKFCVSERHARVSAEAYKKGVHPNKYGENIECTYESTYNVKYPFKVVRNDGKLLKSNNFVDVDNIKLSLFEKFLINTNIVNKFRYIISML